MKVGEATILTLDFEADKFVVLTGQGGAQVKPVIKLAVSQGDRPLKTREEEAIEKEEKEAEQAPAIPHPLEGRDNCLSCHDESGFKPFPADHAGRTADICTGCHQQSQ